MEACLFPAKPFMKCRARNDWTVLPVPALSLKLNCTLIDSYIKEMRAKPAKSDQDLAV